MFLGLRFCARRKGWTGGDGCCTQRVQTAWLPMGLTVETPWSALGRPFLSSFAQIGFENDLLAI